MGRRAVILEFYDNGTAEDFVKLLVEPEKTADEIAALGSYVDEATVEAVIARPTIGCECDSPVESSGGSRRRRRSQAKSRQAGYYRSNRFGWWIHSKCHRPTKPVIRAWIAGMMNGANDLLPVILETGPAVSAHSRWEQDTGLPNSAADEQHFDGGPSSKPLERRRSKRARH